MQSGRYELKLDCLGQFSPYWPYSDEQRQLAEHNYQDLLGKLRAKDKVDRKQFKLQQAQPAAAAAAKAKKPKKFKSLVPKCYPPVRPLPPLARSFARLPALLTT